MKLYFGKVLGNRYVIEIDPAVKGHIGASMKVVDAEKECVYSIDRTFFPSWGAWSDDGIKCALLNEYREDNSK